MLYSIAVMAEREALPESDLTPVIRRAQKGDRAAFDQIVEQHYAGVFALLCKWTGNWHDAEDLTQEAFLRAYKYLNSFRPGENFRSWLYRIALNQAHDFHHDRRQARQTESLENTLEEHLRFDASTVQDLERKQALETIYRLLPQFTPRERSVFVLKTMEGMENDEIARVLGISQTTVRRFYGLARKKILNALKSDVRGELNGSLRRGVQGT
jgi:RNA polymerase sigma-70 factor (ECF subfamily)